MHSFQFTDFKGFRNDKGLKFIPPDYMSSIQNFNFNHIIGLDRILYPEIIYNGSDIYSINGAYRFRYLDDFNVLKIEDIFIKGNNIYKNLVNPILLKSNASDNKFTFTVLNNKLFMANGRDYPLVYDGVAITEMGAPTASKSSELGVLTGTYYYAMTYKVGREQITGSLSNTISVSGLKISLSLPLAPIGSTERKIYRTTNGGTVLKLLTTISDNSTLTYLDNVDDSALGTVIDDVNNECPKPAFITTSYERLIGCVLNDYPTSVYVGESGLEMWNGAIFDDVSNIDGDNTPLKGMARDYNKVIIGSEKNIYILDASKTTPTITGTRANVGVRDGYTMASVPTAGDFTGGVFFVSSLNDVRLFNGNFAEQVATSLDNLRTDNWSEEIQNTFIQNSKASSNFFSVFYDYKYHLVLDNDIYIFDIRLQAWSYYQISTTNYTLSVNTFFIIDNKLYSGQRNNSIIEEWYLDKQYRGEDVICTFSSPQLLYSDKYKWFDSLDIIFGNGENNKWQLTIITDGDYNNKIVVNANFNGGSFFSGDYSENDYNASNDTEDFRVIYIKRFARFIEFKLTVNDEYFYFKGFKVNYSDVNNKESI